MKSSDAYITPPTYARQLGVKPQKVLAWIRAGQLNAINTSSTQNRPRYKLRPQDIEQFEQSIAAVKPVKRRRQNENVIQFF